MDPLSVDQSSPAEGTFAASSLSYESHDSFVSDDDTWVEELGKFQLIRSGGASELDASPPPSTTSPFADDAYTEPGAQTSGAKLHHLGVRDSHGTYDFSSSYGNDSGKPDCTKETAQSPISHEPSMITDPSGPFWTNASLWHARPNESFGTPDPEYSPQFPGLYASHPTVLHHPSPVPIPLLRPGIEWAGQPPRFSFSHTFLPHQPTLFAQSPPLNSEGNVPFDPAEQPAESPSTATGSSPRRESTSTSTSCSEASTFSPPTPDPLLRDLTHPSPAPSPIMALPSPDVHPTALLIASNRALVAASTTSSSTSTAKKSRRRSHQGDEDKPDRRRGSKVTIDVDCVCSQCGKAIARLMLRGKGEDLDVDYVAAFVCLDCIPVQGLERVVEETEGGEEASYSDTISAGVDRLQGIEVLARDDRPPPPKAAVVGKKRKADDEVLLCDVCTREVATGAVVLEDSREVVAFAVEAICERCDERYSRCTDCGGGGGSRLGVGKWRAKELFPGGRKTCRLSHIRLGNLNEMYYDVWPVCDLPPLELESLVVACRDLYFHNNFASLATPEILEPGIALAKTWAEVQSLVIDSFAAVEPMLREDIEEQESIRRYVALRWSTPTPRKNRKKPAAQENSTDTSSEDESPLVRKGKSLAGFVIAEMDLLTGSLFLAATTPWATGETYDATTLLMQNLLRRVEADVAGLNSARRTRRETPYPALNNSWLMMFFKKDSRLMAHLENRRGFLALEDYLEKYPDAERAHFAPHRPVFLPPEYLKGWHVHVRKTCPGDDWNARPNFDKQRKKQDAAVTLAAVKSRGTKTIRSSTGKRR